MTVTTLTSSAISNRAITGLNAATRTIADSTERLATGYRFARASDDAVELSISTGLKAQSVALRQANQNNTQANSMLQVAYSSASSLADILSSMKALAVAANNEALDGTPEADALQLEFAGLRTQLDAIVSNTEFGGQVLLDGTVDLDFQIGEASTNVINVVIDAVDSTTLGINASDITTAAGAVAAQPLLDTAIDTVNGVLASIGASQAQLDAIFDSNSSVITEIDYAYSQMADTDIPSESAKYAAAVVQQQAAISVLAQAQQLGATMLELLDN